MSHKKFLVFTRLLIRSLLSMSTTIYFTFCNDSEQDASMEDSTAAIVARLPFRRRLFYIYDPHSVIQKFPRHLIDVDYEPGLKVVSRSLDSAQENPHIGLTGRWTSFDMRGFD
jgi:hypothetical protein